MGGVDSMYTISIFSGIMIGWRYIKLLPTSNYISFTAAILISTHQFTPQGGLMPPKVGINTTNSTIIAISGFFFTVHSK